MKTIEFEAGDDEVLEQVDTPDGPMVRVRRKVAFLTSPIGNRISTVSSPASGMPFTALKAIVTENAMGPIPGEASKETPVDENKVTAEKTVAEKTVAEKASLWDRFCEAVKVAVGVGQTPVITDTPGKVPAEKVASIDLSQSWDEWFDEWWKLRDAFNDVVGSLTWDDKLADPQGLLVKACDNLKAKAVPMMARRAMLLKEQEALEKAEPAEALSALKAYQDLNTARKDLAEKVGKVVSSANLDRLRRALTALQEVIDVAEPVVAEGVAVTEPAGQGSVAPEGKTTLPGAADEQPPMEGAKKEQAMSEKRAGVLQKLEAVKNAKTDAERVDAVKALEMAIKADGEKVDGEKEEGAAKADGEKDEGTKVDGKAPVAPPFGKPAVVDETAMKALMTSMADAFKAAMADALKAIPGLPLPGDTDAKPELTSAVDNPAIGDQAIETEMFSGGPGDYRKPLNQGGYVAAGTGGPVSLYGARKGGDDHAARKMLELEQKMDRLLAAQGVSATTPVTATKGNGQGHPLDSFLGLDNE